MKNILKLAKETYSIFTSDTSFISDFEVTLSGIKWNGEDIIFLLQYDTLRIAGLLYIFSDEEKRNEIEESLKELFEYVAPKGCVKEIINAFKLGNIVNELYRQLPYSVALMYEFDKTKDNSNLSYTFQKVLEVMVLGVYAPDGNVYENLALMLFTAFAECCENRLKASGIKENNSISISLSPFDDLKDKVDYDEENYIRNIELRTKVEKIYVILKNFAQKEKISKLVKRSRTKVIDEIYSVEEYKEIIEKIQGLDWMTPIEKKKALVVFKNDCKVIECNNYNENTKAIGNIIKCFDYISKHPDEIRRTNYYLEWKQYNEEIENFSSSYGNTVVRKYIHSLENIIEQVRNVLKDTQLLFDKNIIPIEYKHFTAKYVNEENFDLLWSELQKIENKYRIGINYEDRYTVTEWEAELCYEQGKFLEYVEWDGCEITYVPEPQTPYITYSKMSKEQLKLYLYWRTNFRRGKYIFTGTSDGYLCAYELLADLGGFQPEETLKQLEVLYSRYAINALWVDEYAKIHNLSIENKEYKIRPSIHCQYNENTKGLIKTRKGNFENAFEVLCRQSEWKISKSPFIIKSGCIDHVKNAVMDAFSQIEELFSKYGLVFTEWLVGGIEIVEEKWPYSGSVWIRPTVERIVKKPLCEKVFKFIYPNREFYITDAEGNVKRKINTFIQYRDPYLSEYIIKFSEMIFREYFEYPYLKWPTELTGALKVKFARGYDYVLSVDEEEQMKQKQYCKVYTELSTVLRQSIQEYFDKHIEELDVLKKAFLQMENKKASSVSASTIRKSASLEDIASYIESADRDTSIYDLLSFYENATMTVKKQKAKILSSWIWDYWILDGCQLSYEELKERVYRNRWDLSGKKAILNRDYFAAMPYILRYHDLKGGVLRGKFSEGILNDAVVITFTALDKLFAMYHLDSSNIFLGMWKDRMWNMFEWDQPIAYTMKKDIIINLDDVLIYRYDSLDNKATIGGYECGEDTSLFMSYVLKQIDNEFRMACGYKTLLKNELAVEALFSIPGYKKCCCFFNDIITIIVKMVLYINNPKAVQYVERKVQITNSENREYQYDNTKVSNVSFRGTEEFVKDIIHFFYGVEDIEDIKQKNRYDMLEIDLDQFNFNDYIKVCSSEQKKIYQKQISFNLTRFYDIYGELQERVEGIIEYEEEYDPDYNFFVSKIMTPKNGLIGKDLALLTYLLSYGKDFAQWISWIKQGKIIFPQNQPYIQILFHLAINREIYPDNPEACLVMLCEICNQYYNTEEKFDESADLLLEWTKCFWMVYCPDITYDEFKAVFNFEIVFENENGKKSGTDYYLVNLEPLEKAELVSFYNNNCDYKVVYGRLIQEGHRKLLEKSLENVHAALEELWKQYGRNLYDDFQYEDIEYTESRRVLFYRSILTSKTKRYLKSKFKGRVVSSDEIYEIDFDEDTMLPVICFEQQEIRHNASKILLDYIIKQTEKTLRELLGIPCNFKLSETQLNALFRADLYTDNCDTRIIAKTIEKAVIRSYQGKYKMPSEDKVENEKTNILNENHMNLSFGEYYDEFTTEWTKITTELLKLRTKDTGKQTSEQDQNKQYESDNFKEVGEIFEVSSDEDAGKNRNNETLSAEKTNRENTSEETVDVFEYEQEDGLYRPVDQANIIQQSPFERTVVNAGPGTGKTWTLIEKIKYLLVNEQVDPEGILVLCFSRAAVEVIRTRLSDASERGELPVTWSLVDVRTFDSFGTYMIAWVQENIPELLPTKYVLESEDYEMRIKTAREVLDEYPDMMAQYEHIFVDEVQDLVGNRAELVLSLLNSLTETCGFTLFGDSCQALYDYLAENDDSVMTSDEFYRCLLQKFSNASFCSLKKNHRQGNQLARISLPYRNAILSGNSEECVNAARALYDAIQWSDIDLKHMSREKIDKYTASGTLGILTRTNGQALQISSWMKNKGIKHILQKPGTSREFAGWIALVFQKAESDVIEKSEFISIFSELYPEKRDDAASYWYAITDTQRGQSRNHYEIESLLKGILQNAKNPLLYEEPFRDESAVTVSNIHRAKGREFDTVILLNDIISSMAHENSDIEHKVCYVAVTRPRKKLEKVSWSSQYIYISRDEQRRCFKTGRYVGGNYLSQYEIGDGGDFNSRTFGATLVRQNIIRSAVSSGKRLKLLKCAEGTENYVVYKIVLETDEYSVLGYTSPQFAEGVKKAVQRVFHTYRDISFKYYPDMFVDIYIDGLTTCISANGDNIKGARQFGNMYLWTGLSASGFARVKRENY